jgi:hypothetical protein
MKLEIEPRPKLEKPVKPVRLQVDPPLLIMMRKMSVGQFVDVIVEEGNSALLTSKIHAWQKHKKLEGRYSRRQITKKVWRVFKVL